MAIVPLLPSVSRLIGSAQKLADPESVIKELVDNSLDAHATNISVEISANTVDCIVVKDNGSGIQPEDRELACKRFCTSKLREYIDLESIGGQSLGFRGEALSNIAEISGSLQIITKTNGEHVAERLMLSRSGAVESRSPTVHPTGTTVRSSNLFKNIPVRLHYSQASSSKCFSRLFKLMRTYALIRSTVRFSFRVLNSKSTNSSFTYVPNSFGCSINAVRQLFGNSCASQCYKISEERYGSRIMAILPRSDAKASDISGIGPFMSIDGRPMSLKKGPLKQLVKLVSNKISSCVPGVGEPFFLLNFVCPGGSYDANVDNLKDDVIFQDPSLIKAAIEEILLAQYPEKHCDLSYTDACPRSSNSPVDDPALPAGKIQSTYGNVATVFPLPERDANENYASSCGEYINRGGGFGMDRLSADEVGGRNQVIKADHSKEAASCRSKEQEASVTTSRNVADPWILAKLNTSSLRKLRRDNQLRLDTGCSLKRGSIEQSKRVPTHCIPEASVISSPALLRHISSCEEVENEGDVPSEGTMLVRNSGCRVEDGHECDALGFVGSGRQQHQAQTNTKGRSSLFQPRPLRHTGIETDWARLDEQKMPGSSSKITATHTAFTKGAFQVSSPNSTQEVLNFRPHVCHSLGPDRLIEPPTTTDGADIRNFLLRPAGDAKSNQLPQMMDVSESGGGKNQYGRLPLEHASNFSDNRVSNQECLPLLHLLQSPEQLRKLTSKWITFVQKKQVISDYLPYPKYSCRLSDLYHVLVDGDLLKIKILENKILELQKQLAMPKSSN